MQCVNSYSDNITHPTSYLESALMASLLASVSTGREEWPVGEAADDRALRTVSSWPKRRGGGRHPRARAKPILYENDTSRNHIQQGTGKTHTHTD